ncbi:DUF6732 family protein [Oricola thermophila]|uniref:Uncharacterized protein n=1 Tax=Oricola thermophila TaxID=2742145 RepID=A0A6N1V8W5_9HYPH|nr:DUF6732 family protein [Oricola thermophila]QKV17400.1 hypothetical protein HTY61_02415 [Oricola thermophila]
MKTAIRVPAFGAFLLISSPAHAHFGHVGEVAGHSHWIGLAAAGAATAIAIAVSALGRKKDAQAEDVETDSEDSAGDETPAEA